MANKEKPHDEPAFRIPLTEMSDDGFRVGRLIRRAKAGDKKAARELRRMEDEKLVPVDEIPGAPGKKQD